MKRSPSSWFVITSALALAVAPRPIVAEDDISAANLARCKAATVLVDLGPAGSGSGFLVDASGLFATNRHVAEEAPEGASIKLALNSGQADQKIVSARVVALSEDEDLALLKTDEPIKAEPLKLSDDAGLTELTKAIVFGYPFGKTLAQGGEAYPAVSINVGRISSLRREGGQLERIQIDAATNPGNSGGPVLDKDGRVIGIVVSGIRGANVNFAIPAAKLLAMVRQPVLSLRAPEIAYAHRDEAKDFEVEIFPTAPIPADGQIVLKLGEAGPGQRTFPVVRSNGKLTVKAEPCDTLSGAAQPRLRVEADYGPMTVMSNVDDCAIHVGDRALRLSEVRGIDRQNQDETTILAHLDKTANQYETTSGKITGLPKLYSEYNNVVLDLNLAQHVRVGAYDPGLVKMSYELVMTAKGQTVASSRGMLTFVDPPRSLDPDDDVKRSGGGDLNSRRLFGIFFARMNAEGFRVDGLMDPAKDTRQGVWTRNLDGQLETGAEKAAWCDVPAIPTTDYRVAVNFTPRQKGRGELDLQFPVGKARAFLHINGEKGSMSIDVVNGRNDESQVPIAVFDKNKTLHAQITVAVHGESAWIMVDHETGFLEWMGNIKQLTAPKDAPAGLAPVAIGQHDLEMTLNSLEIGAEDGGLRILRELPPQVRRNSDLLVGLYPLDVAPKGKKIPSSGERGVAAIPIGSPLIGAQPAALGAGAMRLIGDSSGLRLEENELSNKGSYPGRTVAFWFRAEAPDTKDQRQYLFAEGCPDKGYAIYLEGGTLLAGGWDVPGGWKGNWLAAPDIVANRWYHVALLVNGREKDKSKAVMFMLDGKEVGRCFGQTFGPHEAIAFGAMVKTMRFREDPAPNPAATNHSFSGMMDELEIYNGFLGRMIQRIMAGGVFQSQPPAKP